ncbi:3'(2'),5'-bisphosphate nucleotidase CysQ [Rarobacter incanus]|uniref:3'(2'),5-bisphosphonucleoside 3'(2')-phosphohydrolase n=1 Tax=Rarobacter incanus TaxID=153494 RepID=A0A542SN89_9MICO|nr:3'(2'),5'-bisphosphate nucleotidase CysQ [Rarobacter incanus]TQK76094.1 3'(2'),5'-bisphosphate nucleotidase [Rarobacter incanus]
MNDHELASDLALQAGGALLELRDRIGDGAYDPARLRAQADRAAQSVLAAALARHAPGDAVLSEEAADDRSRLSRDRVWIIDPLDGTREYSTRTDGAWRDDWAVHVALWTRGGGLTAGAVAEPARERLFSTACDPVARLAPKTPLRIAVSRSHPSDFVRAVLGELDAIPVAMGSAGVKAMAVVDGTVDAYVHAGGQYQWDSAAPVAVARHCGMFTSRIDGAPIEYNREDLSVPDLIVCHPDIQESVQAAVARTLNGKGKLP